MNSARIQRYYSDLYIPPGAARIRLLHVHAPLEEEGPHGPIRCHASVESLESKPSYAALSYVWGAVASPPDTINCQGINLPVSKNCLFALRELRDQLGSFVIWIDAVCINQLDKVEKAQQIPLMGDIYMGAKATYIWLGESSPRKDKAMKYLCHAGLLQYFSTPDAEEKGGQSKSRPWAAVLHYLIFRWTFETDPFPYDNNNLSFLRRISPHGDRGASIQDIDDLLDSPWTMRIWTYQEAVLARNPIIICGHLHIQWERFVYSTVFLSSIPELQYLHRWIEIMVCREQFRSTIGETRMSVDRLTRYWDFCKSVQSTQMRLWSWIFALCLGVPWLGLGIWVIVEVVKATFPGARGDVGGVPVETDIRTVSASIISFLGLSVAVGLMWLSLKNLSGGRHFYFHKKSHIPDLLRSDIHERLQEVLATRKATDTRDMSFGLHAILRSFAQTGIDVPRVDYELSYYKVYRRLTRYLILRSRSLNPLLLAASRRTLGGPSWVPDYAQSLKILEAIGEGATLGSRASGASISWYKFNHYNLTVKGFCYDQVIALSHFHRVSFPYVHLEDCLHRRNLELLITWGIYFRHLNDYWKASTMERWFLRRKRTVPSHFQRILSSATPAIATPDLLEYWDLLSNASRKMGKLEAGFRQAQPPARLQDAVSSAWATLTRRGPFSRRDLLETHTRVCNTLSQNDMKIFRLKRGYIGFGFNDIRIRDRVYLISGLCLPLVMREVGSTVQLVSACYFAEPGYTQLKQRPLSQAQLRMLPSIHNGAAWEDCVKRHNEEDTTSKEKHIDKSISYETLRDSNEVLRSLPNIIIS